MRLYALRGDRVGVLRTFQTCAAILRAELDIEPGADTRDAYLEYTQLNVPEAGSPVYAPAERVPAPGIPQNLPGVLTSFIGRERETSELIRLQAKARLLTLTGPGGCGKTRLALNVARELLAAGEFADGVYWVELAALIDPSSVLKAVASALGLSEQIGQPLLETVAQALRHKQLLLVLDNCEQLIDACVQLAHTLLSTAPGLRILTTSREVLNMPGEATWLVPSLTLPPVSAESDRPTPAQQFMHYEAVRLFVERAAFVLPTFKCTPQNSPMVADICRRLDGIPLAIELAAARVKVLSVEQIAERLNQRFNLLTSGSRAALPRHQSLRAAMDWSYDLLSEPERTLFVRLSVFAGGFTLEAAEAVCNGEGGLDVLSGLALLLDKSLIRQSATQYEIRFSLLETIQAYALEKLNQGGEAERVRRQHTHFFMTWAEAIEPKLNGPEQAAWCERLDQEHHNLRAALDWTSWSPERADFGLRLAGALRLFWWARGHYREGYERSRKLLSLVDAQVRTAVRAKALATAALLARRLNDVEAARSLGEECLSIERELGDLSGAAAALSDLAVVAGMQSDQPAANAWREEALILRRTLGDRHALASSLNNWGEVVRLQGDCTRAIDLYEEALALYREFGNTGGIALVLHNMGHAVQAQRDWRRSGCLFSESLTLYEQMDHKEGIAMCLAGLAGLALARDELLQAAYLLGASEALHEKIGAHMEPADLAAREHYVAFLRARLAEPTFTAAWTHGRALNAAEAIASARHWLQQLDVA